jgi:uncharacterized protein involved in outer membrane biogenesis
MRRRGWWLTTGAVLVALPVAAMGVGSLLFDPNAYKDEIVDAVQATTGRALILRGELRLSRSLWPTLEVNDVLLANLPGGTRADMAHVERIEGQIFLPALLQHRIEITKLVLIGPNILFEQPEGQPNWVFTPATTGPSASAPTAVRSLGHFELRIRKVHVQNGMVTWRLPARTKVVGIQSLEFQHLADDGPVDVASTLVYSDNKPFTLNLTAQPTGSVTQPWTTQLQFAAFDTRASARGTGDVAGHYDLQLEGEAGALEKLNALLPEMNLPTMHGVTVSAHLSNGARPGDLPVVGETRLRFASADLCNRVPGLTFDAVEVSLPAAGGQARVVGNGAYSGTPFKLQGSVGVPAHPDGPVRLPVALQAEVDSGSRGRAGGSLGLKGTLILNTLRFAGLDTQVSLQTSALAGLRSVLGNRLPALTDVRFDGNLAIPGGAGPVGVKDATLTTRQGDWEGSGSVDFGAPITLTGKWRSEKLDLDALLAAFGIDLSVSAGPQSSGGPVIPATRLPWMQLHGPTLDIAAAVSSLTFQREIWPDVQLGVQLRDGRLHVSPFKLGPLDLAMTVDGATEAAPVSLSIRAPTLSLALVARYVDLPGPFSGTARLEAELHGEGQTVRDLAGSLTGPVLLTSVNGTLSNAALIALASPSLRALGITVPPEGDTRLACLGLQGTFEKGVGTFSTIALETTYLSLEGVGRIDLAQENLAFKLYPMAQVNGSQVRVPVLVQGPFRAIDGQLDASGLQQLGVFVDALFGGDRPRACADVGLTQR